MCIFPLQPAYTLRNIIEEICELFVDGGSCAGIIPCLSVSQQGYSPSLWGYVGSVCVYREHIATYSGTMNEHTYLPEPSQAEPSRAE